MKQLCLVHVNRTMFLPDSELTQTIKVETTLMYRAWLGW
jgi:hypothetical protein